MINVDENQFVHVAPTVAPIVHLLLDFLHRHLEVFGLFRPVLVLLLDHNLQRHFLESVHVHNQHILASAPAVPTAMAAVAAMSGGLRANHLLVTWHVHQLLSQLVVLGLTACIHRHVVALFHKLLFLVLEFLDVEILFLITEAVVVFLLVLASVAASGVAVGPVLTVGLLRLVTFFEINTVTVVAQGVGEQLLFLLLSLFILLLFLGAEQIVEGSESLVGIHFVFLADVALLLEVLVVPESAASLLGALD